MKKWMNAVQILVGTFVLAVSVEYFILPYDILSGGVAGIAVALEPFFHIDKTLAANMMVIVLFVLGAGILGKQFALNTMLSSLAYPVFTTLLAKHPVTITIDPVLASFYAGLLGGAGIGIVMRTGASTGGMDIPPLILNKLTGIRIASLVMITDALTVLLGIMAYSLDWALIGMVSVFASGVAVDRVLQWGQGNAKAVQIISDKWETIKSEIDRRISRGTTIIDVKGGFRMEDRKIILCVVSGRQYVTLTDIIQQIDPKAFVITTDAADMHGEGFTYTSPNI